MINNKYTKSNVADVTNALINATINIETVDGGFCPSLELVELDRLSSELLFECIPFYEASSNRLVIKNNDKKPLVMPFEDDARAIARSEKSRVQKLLYFKILRITGIDTKQKSSNTSFSNKIRIRKNKD